MADVRIHAEPHSRALVRLRVQFDAAAQAAAVAGLPAQPLTVAGEDPAALWVGPDQWLVVAHARTPEDVIADLSARLGSVLHHATDASDALALVQLEGRDARGVLGMLSGVDFAAARFPPGQCARTRMAKVAVIAHAIAADRFELYVDRSAALYLVEWLERCATEPLFTAAG